MVGAMVAVTVAVAAIIVGRDGGDGGGCSHCGW